MPGAAEGAEARTAAPGPLTHRCTAHFGWDPAEHGGWEAQGVPRVPGEGRAGWGARLPSLCFARRPSPCYSPRSSAPTLHWPFHSLAGVVFERKMSASTVDVWKRQGSSFCPTSLQTLFRDPEPHSRAVRPDQLELGSRRCELQAVLSWARCFLSLSLWFLICKMGHS